MVIFYISFEFLFGYNTVFQLLKTNSALDSCNTVIKKLWCGLNHTGSFSLNSETDFYYELDTKYYFEIHLPYELHRELNLEIH